MTTTSNRGTGGTISASLATILIGGAGCGPDRSTDRAAIDDPGWVEDLTYIAAERGWTWAETVDAIGWQPAFSDYVQTLRDTYPDAFAGARITPDGPHQAVVGFAGAVPAGVENDPRIAGLDIAFRPDRGFAEAALADQARAVHDAVRAAGFEDVTTTYDLETGDVEVEMVPSKAGRRVPRDELLRTVPALGDNVRVALTQELPAGREALYGGGKMLACTAAFMVKKGASQGYLTAGHCPNSTEWQQNWAGGEGGHATFKAEHKGMWGDLQWHTNNGNTLSSDFYDNVNHTRPASSLGFAVEGMTLCRLGKTTGKRCDEVRKTNTSSQGYHRLVSMKNEYADPGDSGGPWFAGSKLFGVHSGYQWAWFKNRDVFSAVQYVDEALGVSLVFSPPPPPPPPPSGDCTLSTCNQQCGTYGGKCIGGDCICL